MEDSIISRLQDTREWIGDTDYQLNYSLTVFVGIFNGEKYLVSLLEQMETQINQDVYWLVVDNHSSDRSWEIVKSWIVRFPGRITIVRNPTNVGATGSMSINFDLIHTPWVTFFHQDDFYKPDHLLVLSNAVLKAKPEVVAISTDMGSISSSGKILGSPPRSIWFQKTNDPITAFLTNLRAQSIPWGSSAFLVEPFVKVLPAWHSTSFPDTEMVLKLCNYGKFINIPRETMLYQENEMSESHSINYTEKMIGATAALSRVFASQEFVMLCKSVAESDKTDFVSAVLKGIKTRLGESPLATLVSLIASESMAISWNYSEPTSLQTVSSIYKSIDAKFASELLDKLLNSLNYVKSPLLKDGDFQIQDLITLVNRPSSDVMNASSRIRTTYQAMGGYIPYKLRKMILKSLLRLKISVRPKHPWNFKWRQH
jgi:hypothetical protein